MKKKTIYTAIVIAVVAIFALLGIYGRHQSLKNVVGETFWHSPATCSVVNTDPLADYNFETIILLKEQFPNVKIKGPYEKKASAYNGDWIELCLLVPEPNQKDAFSRLEIDVFREKPSVDAKEFTTYSFNIGSQCYKVVSGESDIDEFISSMNLRSLEEAR